MPFNSSTYTDLQLPTLNSDNSTYGTIINNYFQALETKIKNISDRINAAGVGDSSTLAQINSDIDGILPDPYGGNYTTVSTWPSYNTELTALGLSPPQTASEILAFFNGSDITSFVNFLDGKLDDIDDLLDQVDLDIAASEVDVCKANIYSAAVTNPSSITYRTISTGTYVIGGTTPSNQILSHSTTYQLNSVSNYTTSNVGDQVYIGTSVYPVRLLSSSDYGSSGDDVTVTTGSFQIHSTLTSGSWTGTSGEQGNIIQLSDNATYYGYALVEIVQGTPDVSGCG